MPRYTREQVRQRRRIAALILAGLLAVVLGSCAAGIVHLTSRDAGSAPATATPTATRRADADEVAVPTTPERASARAQLPAGEALQEGEVLGVDVSAHQEAIDWASARKAGVAFAYVKATEGVGHVDERFGANWTGAAKAGVARGAYHYFTLCSSGADQALAFLNAVPPDDHALPPAVDLELDGACTQTPDHAAVDKEVDTFVAAVEKGWGRRVVVYSSWEWRDRYSLPDEAARPRWATNLGTRPAEDWGMWQLRFDARVAGIGRDVDLDVMRVDALRGASVIGG